jgi:hypothetical protein
MSILWRTRNGITRVGIMLSRLVKLLLQDINNIASKFKSKSTRNKCDTLISSCHKNESNRKTDTNKSSTIKPVIFISACVNADNPGGWKYNGGIKEYNCLVKLLKGHGYESYIVTYDGNYQEWLIEHQSNISLEEFKSKKEVNKNIRCVTSWAIANSYIKECDRIYFWDMELLYTEHEHFRPLVHLYDSKIVKTAAISRTIQAWHMANFEVPCTVIPNLLDMSYWKPDDKKRIFQRVGYMNEGEHTEEFVDYLKESALKNELSLEFLPISGNEIDVLNGMQTCNLFVSMNLGKDKFWGEGCPRTVIEALSTGAVLLAFDIIGNREILVHNYNSVVVPRYRIDMLAEKMIQLYKNIEMIDCMRANSLALLNACHTLESRWPAVKEFLDL